MGVNLSGRIPRITGAMSPRMIYLAAGLGVLLVFAVLYGFHWRVERKARMQATAAIEDTAADAAPSNRRAMHSEIPGTTPAENLNGTAANQDLLDKGLNKASDAVHAVANPLANPTAKPVNLTCSPNCANQPSPYIPPSQPAAPRLSLKAERERREYERRQAAIEAPTGVGTPTNAASAPASGPVTPVAISQASDQLQAAMSKLGSFAGGIPTAAQPDSSRYDEEDDPNGQQTKRAFQKATDGDYLKTTRTAPLSPWVLERGDVIPAGLPSQLVSDLPGDLVAEVKRDVYDSPQHKYIMIPAGSLVAGEYNSAVNYGQKRAQVIWTYLRFPDGSYIDLDKFVSHSADGSVGLSDQVDNHIKRLIGGIALSSGFAAGLQISQNRTGGNSTLSYPSNAQLAASAVGQQASELGQQITTRNLNVQPSIKIRSGDVFYISVMKSIIFPGPYKPLQQVGMR